MADEQAIRARLGDTWPEGEGVQCRPGVLGGWPCLQSTRWSPIIWHGTYIYQERDADATDRAVAAMYPALTPEQIATARAYVLANLPLFDARAAHVDTEDGWEGLYREDVAALLALLDAARAEREAARVALVALVEKSPLYVRNGEHGWKVGWLCWYCDGQELLPGHAEGHKPDCPWAKAGALVARGAGGAGDVAASEG